MNHLKTGVQRSPKRHVYEVCLYEPKVVRETISNGLPHLEGKSDFN
jgi:hypothetical protein